MAADLSPARLIIPRLTTWTREPPGDTPRRSRGSLTPCTNKALASRAAELLQVRLSARPHTHTRTHTPKSNLSLQLPWPSTFPPTHQSLVAAVLVVRIHWHKCWQMSGVGSLSNLIPTTDPTGSRPHSTEEEELPLRLVSSEAFVTRQMWALPPTLTTPRRNKNIGLNKKKAKKPFFFQASFVLLTPLWERTDKREASVGRHDVGVGDVAYSGAV